MSSFAPGQRVSTPFGKGTVKDVLNGGRLLVDIGARTVVFRQSEVHALVLAERPAKTSHRSGAMISPPQPAAVSRSLDIDLHGLHVVAALVRIDEALNDACLDGTPELRFIHGRSGGKLRSALHQRLREIPAVRGFRLDPRNPGVTIVSL